MAITTAATPISQYKNTTAMNVRGCSLYLIWRPSQGLKTLSVTLEIVDAKASTKNTAPKTSPRSDIVELFCMINGVPPNT
jgi:hypothetical protein